MKKCSSSRETKGQSWNWGYKFCVLIHLRDTTKDQQPKALHKIMFQNAAVTKDTKFYDDESKINHLYKKGQAIYNLIKMFGIIQALASGLLAIIGQLKKMTKIEINRELEPCIPIYMSQILNPLFVSKNGMG